MPVSLHDAVTCNERNVTCEDGTFHHNREQQAAKQRRMRVSADGSRSVGKGP